MANDSVQAKKKRTKQLNSLRRRVGKFNIPLKTIEFQPEVVMAVLGQCIVLRAEHLQAMDETEYVARCPQFAECNPGRMIPRYHAIVQQDGKKYQITWQRE